jgi:hypothetical protein
VKPRTIFEEASESVAISGRYAIFNLGRECGEERWDLTAVRDGYVVVGEQITTPPHPFPSVQEYRVTLTREWRVTGVEVLWTVGERRLRAIHVADGKTWRARIEYAGEVKEQHGDFPEVCEVEYGTHLFNAFILARREFALEGEHEFPVLRIGPPWMAVQPDRMLVRCVEIGVFPSPGGPIPAKRYVVSLPPRPESEGYAFWADENGFVLESYEGLDSARPWMRLIELKSGE